MNKQKQVIIEKTSTGCFIVKVNGRIVRNSHSCPKGAATFASEAEARAWYEENNNMAIFAQRTEKVK